MKFVVVILAAGLLAHTIDQDRLASLVVAGNIDLASIRGGSCEICTDDSTSCTGTTCTKVKDGEYTQKTGNLITPRKCGPAPVGTNNGFTKCATNDKKACFTYKTCTGIDKGSCTGCGPGTAPAGNDLPTTCSTTGGYRCNGTGK